MAGGFISPFGNVVGPSFNPSLSNQQQKPMIAKQKETAVPKEPNNEDLIGKSPQDYHELSSLVMPQVFERSATNTPTEKFTQSALPTPTVIASPTALPGQPLMLPVLTRQAQLPGQQIPFILA